MKNFPEKHDRKDCNALCRSADELLTEGESIKRGLRLAGFTDDQILLAGVAVMDAWTDMHDERCMHTEKGIAATATGLGIVYLMRNTEEDCT